MPSITYSLEDRIITNYSGYNQLSKFYHFCLTQPPKSNIHISFSNVDWFDGNLSALLWAMVHQINKNFGHSFSTDANDIKERFDVLFRNGFLKSESPVYDDRKSTIPIKSFDCNDKEGFCRYIQKDLLIHRGIPNNLNEDLKEKIADDLLEIFCNTNHHANTKEPFFVGGQYYPKKSCLIFTMVDLGDGFLPRINKATNGAVETDLDAILWAIEGNSSKKVLDDCPGGLGIKNILKYCQANNGILQIISGNGYWASDLENSIFQGGRIFATPFIGTTINLFFKNF
jgi:hypothetical protein